MCHFLLWALYSVTGLNAVKKHILIGHFWMRQYLMCLIFHCLFIPVLGKGGLFEFFGLLYYFFFYFYFLL
ncbi:hypothetical protein GDO81_027827 [Engystomops pustulosus]|uniref:Uncharacterized protein n=1 Tax=Engystomops pustulosus TaxID=76066 RepID=A0AAV6YP17_ENGPU|nr:hypothetical protein GDO81_027827 [Engystomops pustulosus]